MLEGEGHSILQTIITDAESIVLKSLKITIITGPEMFLKISSLETLKIRVEFNLYFSCYERTLRLFQLGLHCAFSRR